MKNILDSTKNDPFIVDFSNRVNFAFGDDGLIIVLIKPINQIRIFDLKGNYIKTINWFEKGIYRPFNETLFYDNGNIYVRFFVDGGERQKIIKIDKDTEKKSIIKLPKAFGNSLEIKNGMLFDPEYPQALVLTVDEKAKIKYMQEKHNKLFVKTGQSWKGQIICFDKDCNENYKALSTGHFDSASILGTNKDEEMYIRISGYKGETLRTEMQDRFTVIYNDFWLDIIDKNKNIISEIYLDEIPVTAPEIFVNSNGDLVYAKYVLKDKIYKFLLLVKEK